MWMAIGLLVIWFICLTINTNILKNSFDEDKVERKLLILKIESGFHDMTYDVLQLNSKKLNELRNKLCYIEYELNIPGESEKLLALIDHLGLKFIPEQKELKRAHFVEKESK